jgi:RHS repeat-associated protein
MTYATTGSSSSSVMWTVMAYDVLGRMTQRIEPEDTATWSYDAYASGAQCTMGIGKLCEVTTSTGEDRQYVYDGAGRPLNTLNAYPGKVAPPAFATAVSYDPTTGRVNSQTYPTGLVINSKYTAKGYPLNLTLGTPTSASSQSFPATPGGAAGAAISMTAGTVLWTAGAVDAWGRVEQQTYGNRVAGTAQFDGRTGRAMNLAAAASGSSTNNVLNYGYVWDSLGRLQNRTDAIANGSAGGSVTETMGYDQLNRLSRYLVSGVGGLGRQQTFEYNALGEMLYRSDLGVYNYSAQGSGSAQPHAVASVGGTGAVNNISYLYDLQGNLTTAKGTGNLYKNINYTSFNLPDGLSGVTGDGANYTWQYDENHQRIMEGRNDTTVNVNVTAVGPTGTSSALGDSNGIAPGVIATGTRVTWYVHPNNAGGLTYEWETTHPSSGSPTSLSRHYLTAGGSVIGLLESSGAVPAPNGTAPASITSITLVKVEYWHKDALGSIVATTDQNGAVTDRYAYDPFGKRRYTTGAYDATGALIADYTNNTSSGTARGFTGHEHLDEIGMINMNGRMFDSTIGRFMQADPLIEDPYDMRTYNRYSYCANSPMGCIDATGYCFLGCFWQGSHLAADWHELWDNQVFRGIAIAVASYFTADAAGAVYLEGGGQAAIDGFAQDAAAASEVGDTTAAQAAIAQGYAAANTGSMISAAAGGFVGGMIGSNGNLKAGLEGAAFGMANGYIGGQWSTDSALAQNAVAHMVLGCVQGVAGHSKCGSGALSAGFTSLFESDYGDGGKDPIAGAIEASVVGGTASVIGGGKFVNGAEVASFMYLFNSLWHSHQGNTLVDDQGNAVVNGSGQSIMVPSDVNMHYFVQQGQDALMADQMNAEGGVPLTYANLANFGVGGPWDIQRVGSDTWMTGQFRDVANLAIGVYAASAGIPLSTVLSIANDSVSMGMMSRWAPGTDMDTTYTSLPQRNVQDITIGYGLVTSGRVH